MEFKVEPKKICFKGFALAANGAEKIKINNKEYHGGWVEGDFSQYDTEYYIKNYRKWNATLSAT